ncbi:MAG: TMEM175 family protein [Alphaproteobacteria bacterium]
MTAEPKEFISKGRLDALTDGVFAFAMTLLVVNLDLPETFHPKSSAELVSGLLGVSGSKRCSGGCVSCKGVAAALSSSQIRSIISRL